MAVPYEKYKIESDYFGHDLYILDKHSLIYKCKKCNITCEVLYLPSGILQKLVKQIVNCDYYENIIISCEEQQIKNILE